jgi:NDP-sugar pyrophosphorylase family protein
LIVAYGKRETPSQNVPASLLAANLGVGQDGVVTAYSKRNPVGLTDIDAGVVVLKKEILSRLPAGQKSSLEEEIYPQLIAEGEMRAWVTPEPFYDMGSPAGLASLEAKLA